ncbi:ATP-dependent DNA ligase [Cohnella xylanilytica]|uniref:ATP-dependent DNA ligase n=2 Tax=Cohnella xylanilytica TaxID=557555 RepID=A0A841TUQ7_9BACL|nr:ATP-dependent DNA ligase [Cohnella xylanilytica]
MFLPPMLLQKREQPFDEERFIFEPKIDGHRLIVSVVDGHVRLYTRHHNDVTRQYPELHDVPVAGGADVVLDGEVAVVQPNTGAVDFEAVMERFHIRRPGRIAQAAISQPVQFFVFDILHYRGADLRGLPLSERKAILREVIGSNQYFSHVLSIPREGRALFEAVKEKQLEGIVAKRADSRYVGRRDPAWQKIINYMYADVAIFGYRRGDFGWLVQHEGRPAGIIELAVPASHKQAFYRVTSGLIAGEDRNFVYLEPRIKAHVRFRNWTKRGLLRSPEFVRFIL